jgi:transcriptional accessory protein Tex/SPT6
MASSLQEALPRADCRRSLEQLLITAVSQVGVCPNECADKDWLAPLLRFVPGLGPRKAEHVVKARCYSTSHTGVSTLQMVTISLCP